MSGLQAPLRVPLCAAAIAFLIAAVPRSFAFAASAEPDSREIAQIARTTQNIRGLPLQHTVEIVQMTPEQAASTLARTQSAMVSNQTMTAESRAGAMLGLFAKGTDLKIASLRMYRSQLLAFYNFQTQQMVLVDGTTTPPAAPDQNTMNRMILAHEMTHALQDQNFSLGARLDALRGDSDRELALRSVAEGDATLVGWTSATGRFPNGADSDSGSEGAPRTPSVPADNDSLSGSEYFNFPYLSGLRFVAEAYRRGGWLAVNALYADPPQSTQQIIDPSLYFDRPTLPETVEVGGYSALSGWTPIATDTYGELAIRVILERNLGMQSPAVADARNWSGDRMVLLGRGDDLTVIWILAFRDAVSANRFAIDYSGVMARIESRVTPYRVIAMGPAVLVIVGAPAHDDALVRAIWEASTIAPHHRTVQ